MSTLSITVDLETLFLFVPKRKPVLKEKFLKKHEPTIDHR